eukprot:TRINITY_DN295_c0_g1_i1.p1 TRINITY_DN295_c0_g1~~TRINITY_DN295_c0_g1_i1.p1  ORF type:complete len:309 (-),score=95.59 TRINITY_DN295_c0_g1_i1:61-987(-)
MIWGVSVLITALLRVHACLSDTTVQIDVSAVLSSRSVSTYTNGQIVPWNQGYDGMYSGEATLAVAQALGNNNPKALPDNGFFPANSRHPDVQLHWNNNDGTSPQSRFGSGSYGFAVPAGKYSLLHLFGLSANGNSNVNVDIQYDDGVVTKSISVPDWYTYTDTSDVYVLANDLDKWSNTNARLEQGHHYIFGLDLHVDAGRTITKLNINANGYFTFYGATGQISGGTEAPTTAAPTNAPSTAAPSVTATPTAAPPTAAPTTGGSCSNKVYDMCGGATYTGESCCPAGTSCKYQNQWYSQCLPGSVDAQ